MVCVFIQLLQGVLYLDYTGCYYYDYTVVCVYLAITDVLYLDYTECYYDYTGVCVYSTVTGCFY